MLNRVPENDQPKGEEEGKFWRSVAYELATLLQNAAQAKEPEIVLNEMRVAGSQYIWEFYVNDLACPKGNAMNFHGQNTSQWLYAGCVLLQGGRVSSHH